MTEQSEKAPPEIISEEDIPLLQTSAASSTDDKALATESSANGSLDFSKFKLGSSALGWCIFLMFVCILLSLWFPDGELVKSGFEAFKLIVMTILGYIFGSNNSKQN